MGWSMSGILAGAAQGFGKGIADWAGREIADEKKIGEEARLVERQKEMARYNDELSGARDVAKAELTEKINERVENKKRESIAANMAEVSLHNSELKLKPGSKEWMQEGAKFLLESGRPDEAKTFLEQYKSERDYEAKMAEVGAKRAEANARNAESKNYREGQLDIRREEREAANHKEHLAQLNGLGTYKFKDKVTGEDTVDMSGVAPLRTFDGQLSNLKTESGKPAFGREERLNIAAQIRADADNYFNARAASKKPVTRTEAYRASVNQYVIDNKLGEKYKP